MAMSTYWQVSATVSKIITAHGNSPTPAATCRNMTKQTPKSTAWREANKAAALLSQRLRQKWWKAIISVRLSRLTMLPPQSTNYREVNVYTAAENIKKLADGDLYITSTKEVRDTELFMARAQSIRNVS